MRFGFTHREIRALAILFPVLAVSAWIIVCLSHGGTSSTEILYATSALNPMQSDVSRLQTDNDTTVSNAIRPFPFDPNTVTYEELRQMGVDKKTSVNIIKYRNAGKVFRIKEDLATCYGMTDSLYYVLSSFITIGEPYAIKPTNHYGRQKSYTANQSETKLFTSYPNDSTGVQPEHGGDTADADIAVSHSQEPDLFVFDPNKADKATFMKLGFTQRQAETIIKYRESCNGYRNAEHFGRCYAVSQQMLARLRPYIEFSAESDKTELNGADSASLVSINGIGAWSASQIIIYRNRLGGYSEKEQLLDLEAVTEENYKKICEQIWIDTCKIQKIDINFATPERMAQHPYITGTRLRKILKTRQLKGGWDTVEDMISDNTLTVWEAQKLAPYLQFVRIEP